MRRVCKILFGFWHCPATLKQGGCSYAFRVRNILLSHSCSPCTRHSLDKHLGLPEEERLGQTTSGGSQDCEGRSSDPASRWCKSRACAAQENMAVGHKPGDTFKMSKQTALHSSREACPDLILLCLNTYQ